MSFISAFRAGWKSIAFPRFKDMNFIVFQQAAFAGSVFVLVNGMAEGKRKMVTGHGLIPALLVLGGGLRFLGGRRFRPVSFPLALLLLVFFLQPIKGNALTLKGHVLAGIVPMMETPTAQKAYQEAGEPGKKRDLKNSGIRPNEPKDDGNGDGADDHGNKTDNMFVCHVCDAVLSGAMGLFIGFLLGILMERHDTNICISMMKRHFLLENKEQDK